MKFIKIYATILIISYLFVFFGGWILFDFKNNYFIAIAVCAFIIAVVGYIFYTQEEKIDRLEDRIKKLEDNMDVESWKVIMIIGVLKKDYAN